MVLLNWAAELLLLVRVLLSVLAALLGLLLACCSLLLRWSEPGEGGESGSSRRGRGIRTGPRLDLLLVLWDGLLGGGQLADQPHGGGASVQWG